jgi:GTP cyclohydrolase I
MTSTATPAALGLELKQRSITPEQREELKESIAKILGTLGLDLDSPGAANTPERFLQALIDITDGYEGDPKLITVFDTECRGGSDCSLSQIIEGPIPFFSLCEHHALPVYGHAYVGYIAHEHIVGISKLTRLVRLFAKRFTVQERLGQQIADALSGILEPHGTAVYLEAHHMCVQMRGVREASPMTRTTCWRGEYERNSDLRREFFDVAGVRR